MPKLKPGDRAPDFNLPSTAGPKVRLADELPKYPLTVVLFLCNHCPYVVGSVDRLIKLQAEFDPKTAGTKATRFIGICSNDAVTYPEDSFEKMKQYAAKWGFNFPYLRDEDQSVARAYGAERTPEIFLLNGQGVCLYEGALDDSPRDASKVTQRPLREAILAAAAGQPIKEPQTHAIGCTIKWKGGS